ncbi:unnamed protein product [Prorocentrum cordatum]|uniref:Solute carrier family 40 protein n=1 Tax=Prorocentrum cordatum TaxID=2364126 RepID=A0ABN9THQ8_9DINO|nr:unnamed protein product [Polarella glacialis]
MPGTSWVKIAKLTSPRWNARNELGENCRAHAAPFVITALSCDRALSTQHSWRKDTTYVANHKVDDLKKHRAMAIVRCDWRAIEAAATHIDQAKSAPGVLGHFRHPKGPEHARGEIGFQLADTALHVSRKAQPAALADQLLFAQLGRARAKALPIWGVMCPEGDSKDPRKVLERCCVIIVALRSRAMLVGGALVLAPAVASGKFVGSGTSFCMGLLAGSYAAHTLLWVWYACREDMDSPALRLAMLVPGGASMRAKGLLRGALAGARTRAPLGKLSGNYLLGHVLSLNEVLLASLANPTIVLAVAVMMLSIICIIRRHLDLDSSFEKDIMTFGLITGSLHLPKIAAACVIATPCYHTQTEDYMETDEAAGTFLMAYSTEESSEKRWRHIAIQSMRFLTASDGLENQGWETNRLAKNILLKCAVAAAPISYYPGLQLSLVQCMMFSFTAWQLRNFPYQLKMLNIVGAVSLDALNPFDAHGLLAINALRLASLSLWAKFRLDDEHEPFTKVRGVPS